MATVYYVGSGTSGTPTGWNNSAYWSTTSSGASGAGIPGSADTAIFDGGSKYCTLDTAMNIAALTLSSGYVSTLSFGSFGSTVSASTGVTLLQGTLNLNGQSCTWSTFASTGSLVRSIVGSTSTVTINGTTAQWNMGSSNATNSTSNMSLVFTGSNPALTVGGTVTFSGVTFIGTGTSTTNQAFTCSTLTYAPTAGNSNILSLGGNTTVSTTLTLAGAVAPNAVLIESSRYLWETHLEFNRD